MLFLIAKIHIFQETDKLCRENKAHTINRVSKYHTMAIVQMSGKQ